MSNHKFMSPCISLSLSASSFSLRPPDAEVSGVVRGPASPGPGPGPGR